jgi:SNF2 family DNA or RNA helicase
MLFLFFNGHKKHVNFGPKMETPCNNLNMETETELDNRVTHFKNYLEHSHLTHNTYQYQGVRWCLRNELYPPIQNVRGGFLADEMGLGKTIMMIGLMFCNPQLRTLIVLPPVLMEQWALQIFKTTGYKPIIYHGQNKKNIDILHLKKSFIVLTTYGTIVNKISKSKNKNGETYVNKLYQIRWGRIIFDEAHHLRNKNTNRNICVHQLKSNIKWLVSGTPIQNSLRDLINLCDILGLEKTANKENVCEIIRSYMLRRTKTGVGINIPDLQIAHRTIEWKTRNEKKMAQDIHSLISFSNVTSKNSHLFDHIETQLVRLMLVRQMCIYPPLIKNMPEYYDNSHLSYDSKMDYVSRFISRRIYNGNGKIVFCHFRREIDELVKRLYEYQPNARISVIDGRINLKKRNIILSETYDVLILQIQTCSEGLNLQDKYSEVYFTSPHWNPAIEDQAIARCHRIGQKKRVYVFKFVMNSTVVQKEENDEEKSCDDYICIKQTIKRNLANKYIEFATS